LRFGFGSAAWKGLACLVALMRLLAGIVTKFTLSAVYSYLWLLSDYLPAFHHCVSIPTTLQGYINPNLNPDPVIPSDEDSYLAGSRGWEQSSDDCSAMATFSQVYAHGTACLLEKIE
jgi:hypothetical protein